MPLRLCLVGAGHMGRIHTQKLARMKDVDLAWIIDAKVDQAAEVARACGAAWSNHHGQALSDGVEAVVIASVTETHFPIARDFLEKGVHVFVEKPITATPQEATELIELARKRSCVLQVGHLERFSPPFRKARRAVKAPYLIEAHRIGVFTGRSTDIDVVHDLMIHDIDLVLSLNGSAIRSISARGTPVHTSRTDIASARIEFSDGCVATLTASRASGTKERVFKIIEKDRFFSCDLAAGQLLAFEETPSGKRKASAFKAARPDPVRDELRAFIRTVRGSTEDAVSGEEGLRALLVADSITAEIESGQKTTRATPTGAREEGR